MITMQTKSAAAPGTGKRVSILKSVPFANATGLLSRFVRWIMARQKQRNASRSLQLEETVSLGQKRFVALLTVNDQRFLVGGGADDVVLLASLGTVPAVVVPVAAPKAEEASAAAVVETPFREVLERTAAADQPKKTKAARRKPAKDVVPVLVPESVPAVPPVVEFLVAPQAEERAPVAIEEILHLEPPSVVATVEPKPVTLGEEPAVAIEPAPAPVIEAPADVIKPVPALVMKAKEVRERSAVAKESKKAKVAPKVVVRLGKSKPAASKAASAAPTKAAGPAPAKAPQAKKTAKEPSASFAVLHRPAAKTVKKAKPSKRGGGKSKR